MDNPKTRLNISLESKLKIFDDAIKQDNDIIFTNHALYVLREYLRPKLGLDAKINSYNIEKSWKNLLYINFARYKLKENEKVN